jgi:hypothetical protein
MNATMTLQDALRQLESERAQVDRQITAVRMALDGVGAGAPTSRPRRRRGMGAAARAAIGRRMKAYWAKRRAAKAKGKGSKKTK